MEILSCPCCRRIIDVTCLTSNPVKYTAWCSRCGFSLPYWARKNGSAEITQTELNRYKRKQDKEVDHVE